jgi:hypothetical protein
VSFFLNASTLIDFFVWLAYYYDAWSQNKNQASAWF